MSPHSHIVQLLAAFRHDATFYLLFPWAQGDLRCYWRETSKPIHNATLQSWVTGQLAGLASAIRRIHHQHKIHKGRHGDIKPENILWFRTQTGGDRNSVGGILKLSDFGLSRMNPTTGQNANERPTGYSRTYRAPEFDVRGAIGSEYDLWSFGCVVIETAVWMIRGWDGVVSFAFSRAGRTGRGDDAFFTQATPKKGRPPLVYLKPVVLYVRPTVALLRNSQLIFAVDQRPHSG